MDILKHSFKFLKQFYLSPDKNLKIFLSNFLDTNDVDSHQGVTRTVYSVIRRELELDTVIHQLTRRTSGKIETDVLTILRISIYLLIYSQSYPDYAVVNEAVRLAKRRSKGFVNAVLRRCAAERDAITALVGQIQDPHIKYSMANLLIDHLKTMADDFMPLVEYLDREPVFHIRVNKNLFAYDTVKKVLKENRFIFKELRKFDTFEIESSGGAGSRLRSLLQEAKYFYFQNPASQFISIIAAKYADKSVLDCCTAPGAKSFTLSLLKPGLNIIANDIHEQRLRLVKQFCTGYELTNIKLMAADAGALYLKGHFDLVILDAPCTSSGTLRKNPDLKLKINQELVEKNAENQYRILHGVLQNISTDYILYSVCSFIADETEIVLERIFKEERNIERQDLTSILEEYGFVFKKAAYGFYLLANEELNNDLFYLSLIRRRKSLEPKEMGSRPADLPDLLT